MSKIALILKDISDIYVRDNFYRLQKYFNDSVFFDGDFDFYEIEIPEANTNFKIRHGLKFIPTDIILLAVYGDFNFYFKYQNFDRDFIYVHANGPCSLRFLAGKLTNKGRSAVNKNFPLVPPDTGGGGSTLITKSILLDGAAFTGTPKKLIVTFVGEGLTAFPGGIDYTIGFTGEDARNWSYESRDENGFTVNTHANTQPTGEVAAQCIEVGET